LVLTAGFSFLVACYEGEFDPDASSVYACSADDECADGQICFNSVCVSDVGPSLSIIGPEPFQLIAADNTDQLSAFTITVRGSDLTLTDSPQPVDGEGYIEVTVDGEDMLGRIVSGDLASGLTTPPLDISSAGVGPHRIRVRAVYGNDDPYVNPSSVAESIFFIDDGSPQVAVVEPRPGHRQAVDKPMAVTVAAINWTWNSAGSDLADAQGHTHTFSLAEYPGCLAAEPTSDEYCNFKYLGSFSGSGDPANPILIHGEVESEGNLDLLPLGTRPFQAGLQDNAHEPYPSAAAPEFDQVTIELVSGN
jgi:hypothetical protein